jgi:hypothetical protein
LAPARLLFQAILIGQPPSVGSLEFNLPFNGDTITVRIYDQDQANGASVSLVVAPVPQSILIDSPRAGALVGSPMTITGRTVSFPANGQLTYRVTTAVGGQLGEGSFPVGANSTSGSQFNAQIKFSVPREGGIVQLTISDPTAPTGAVETTIDLDVRPQYQRIDINTPPAGTLVSSPMTITGRTNWFSNNGQLTYRVLDAGNAMIGSGTIPVKGAPGERGSFNGQVLFTEPSNGGTIRVELSDPSNGSNITTAIQLNVAPPPPPQIVIDSPPPGRQVGSPMMITGHTTYVPNGQLSYRVRDAAGNVIGQGGVPFAPNGRQANLTASLTFTEPTVGGNIVLEVFGPSPVASTMISTSITFYVAPLQRTSISASTQIPISTPTPNSSAAQTAAAVASIQTDQALATAATQTAAVAQIVTASAADSSTPTPVAPIAVPTPAPPAVIFAEYPIYMSTNISSSISLTLNLAGLPIPTTVPPRQTTELGPVTQAPLERTAATALVTPIGTPGMGLSKAAVNRLIPMIDPTLDGKMCSSSFKCARPSL